MPAVIHWIILHPEKSWWTMMNQYMATGTTEAAFDSFGLSWFSDGSQVVPGWRPAIGFEDGEAGDSSGKSVMPGLFIFGVVNLGKHQLSAVLDGENMKYPPIRPILRFVESTCLIMFDEFIACWWILHVDQLPVFKLPVWLVRPPNVGKCFDYVNPISDTFIIML